MTKTGTVPHYLYTAKISDAAEITEEYSIPLIGADRCINCCSERERGSNRRSARR